jgi:hypothetical protein
MTKEERAEQRAQKRRLESDAHLELDRLCRVAVRLTAVETKNDLERLTIDLIRQALLRRTKQIGKMLNDAGIKPARDHPRI